MPTFPLNPSVHRYWGIVFRFEGSQLSKECPDGSLMLWRDETISVRGGPHQLQVSNIWNPANTVFQAHDTSLLRIGTTTPDNQSVETATATLRKQLAER
jgi:hypothetical protein